MSLFRPAYGTSTSTDIEQNSLCVLRYFLGQRKDTKRQGDRSLLNVCLQLRNGSDTFLNSDPSICAYRLSRRLDLPRGEEILMN